MSNQARNIVFKCARESWSDCRDRISPLGIAPQARQMNDFHDAINDCLEWLALRREDEGDRRIPRQEAVLS